MQQGVSTPVQVPLSPSAYSGVMLGDPRALLILDMIGAGALAAAAIALWHRIRQRNMERF
jgi:hypothetical protein